MRKYKKGFTLIELLVVITILIILAATLVLIINPVEILKKSRDGKRISEITELNKAIVLSIVDNLITFPLMDTGERSSCLTIDTDVDGTGWAGGWAGSIRAYIPALPLDPVNIHPNNCYLFSMSAAGSWEIDAVIESVSYIDLAINDSGNSNLCVADSLPNLGCRYEVGTDLELL